MPKIAELLEEPWISLLSKYASPSIASVEEFLERDCFTLAKQLQCNYDQLNLCKRQLALKILFPNKTIPIDIDTESSLGFFESAIPTIRGSSIPPSLPTGIPTLDAMFGGAGFPPGQIISLLGDSCSGKSQICMTSAVAVASIGKRVLYIDSNGGQLCVRRLYSLLGTNIIEERLTNLSAFTQEENHRRIVSTLELIDRHCCFDLWQALDFLTQISDSIKSDPDSNPVPCKYDLIIIDSIHQWIAPFLSDSQKEKTPTVVSTSAALASSAGLGTTSKSSLVCNVHPLLSQLMILIRSICCKSPKTCIIVTNSTVSKEMTRSTSISGQTQETGSAPIPLGGINHSLDVFDSIIHLTNLSGGIDSSIGQDQIETIIKAVVILRPPYFFGKPDTAVINIISL